MAYFMGIDVGTSSVKAVVIDECGVEVASGSKKYDVLYPELNYAEQNPEEIWAATKEMLLELSGKFAEIIEGLKGISFSGQMHGLLLIDKDGKPVHNMIIWQDHRSMDQKAKIYSRVPYEEYNSVSLNQMSPGDLVMSLMWMKEYKPEIYDRSDLFLLPKDYIRYKMCGNLGTDMSDASASMIFDTSNKCWPDDLIRKLGLRRELFPECHKAWEVAGVISKECAENTGLKAGNPVMFGGGDTLMHEIGTGLIGEERP